MFAEPKDEPARIPMSGLNDGYENCVDVWLYAKSNMLEETREMLIDRYGGIVKITVTEEQLTTLSSDYISQQSPEWLLVSAILFTGFMTGFMHFIWRKKTSRRYAMQTTESTVIIVPRHISTASVISAIKSATVTPRDSLFSKIMNSVEQL